MEELEQHTEQIKEPRELLCSLDPEYNTCPYFKKENRLCGRSQDPCSMQEESRSASGNSKYERKERWYEKYYKE